jgi:Carboxypeptidase regulatory-like domain/TonB dependent receptor
MQYRYWKAIVLSLVLVGICRAQQVTGDLLVNIADSSGSTVPAATLTLTQNSTSLKFVATSDELGNALYPQLQPGIYTLSVSKTGFQPHSVKDILIQVGQRARVDVRINIGTLTETVTVSAAQTTLLNAESASAGQVISQKPIVDLPLNGRNFIQLAQLSSGAVPLGIGVSPATNWTGRGDTTLSIAGLRESNVSFLVNGIETRNARFGSSGIRPSVEAIQEFRVQRSTFGAEFGRSAAIINTTIRSGSNELHGSVFEFHRNRVLDANDFFLNQTGRDKPPLTLNNFGTAVGGPLVIPKLYDGRNRTFWFFNYEGFRQRQSSAPRATYPSREQLRGNLADDSAGTGLFPTNSPFCQQNADSEKCVDVLDPHTGQPFLDNVIPAPMLDAQTQLALEFIPTPNFGVPAGSRDFPEFNTVGTVPLINDWDQFNARLDHQLGQSDQVYGTFAWSDETRIPKALRPFGGESFPLSNRLVTATHMHTFSSSIINEFRFGYNRSRTFRLSETSYGRDFAREVFGLKNTTDQPIMFGVPSFSVTGFSAIGSISQAIGAEDENFQFTDNLSITRGAHNVRTGFQISKQNYYQITNFSGNPSFLFDGRYTGTDDNGLAEFLLGIPSRASGAIGDSIQDMYTTYWAGYIQDDWHIVPNFTLNIGVRYEFSRPPYERNDKSLWFSPELGRIFLAGQGIRREIVDPDWNNWAPRIGFAYRPSFLRDTVIRGGAGIYYSTDNWNEEQFKGMGPPLFQAQTLEGDPTHPNLSMKDMLPSFTASQSLNPFTFDRLNRTPYLTQWTFGIQRSFLKDFLLEIEYAGSTGQKLPQRRNLNIATIDPTGLVPIRDRVPYPQYGFILLTYNGGWSSYNALTAKLEKRFSNGFYGLFSYTWQKSLDLGATDEFSAISVEQKKWDKGPSTFDVPHRFVASYSYELPIGRGKPFLAGLNRFANALLGGWQVTGITTFSAGQAQTPTLGIDWLLIGSFSQSRPNIIGDMKEGRSLPFNYLNPDAFERPPNGVQGSAARGSIRQPGINNWDLGVVKNSRINERLKMQFRWEMFNAFNHTQFGSANLDLSSLNFGRIGGTLIGPRRMQVGLKLLF